MKRGWTVALIAATLGSLAFTGGCTGPEPQEAPPEPELMPGGYRMVLDRDRRDPGHFVTEETPDGVRFTTGPAGIAWRPADTVSAGEYRVEGTFTQMGAPVGYREAYGIFAGGRGLEGTAPSYVYLLVRATGDFTVRRLASDSVATLVEWTSHMAVQRVVDDGDQPTNALGIEVREEETRFLVNGTVVFILTEPEARPYGIAGVRVNHRLDVVLGAWEVGAVQPEDVATSDP